MSTSVPGSRRDDAAAAVQARTAATQVRTVPATGTELREHNRESLFTNRELSWLDFNDRVLQLAEGDSLPLLERVKFLAIFTTNLDEFFMIRVAGVHDQVEARIDARGPDGLSPMQTLDGIAEKVAELDGRHSRQWREVIQPALAEHGIRIVGCQAPEAAEADMDGHFRDQIFPVLTPLAIGPGRPFPYISNLSLSLIVRLRDPELDHDSFARVKVPKEVLPRFVEIGKNTFVPLEQIIAEHLDALFPGLEIVSYDLFRVTRDADFEVNDEADDLLQEVEEELRRRRFGEVVRLEVGAGMDPLLRSKLIEWLGVDELQVYDVEGLLDLSDLWQIAGVEGHADLKLPSWTPVMHPAFGPGPGADDEAPDVLAAMRASDILVHFPYQSFATSVERFVEQAAEDPDVLAIKMTVYRTSDDSALDPVADPRRRARQAGRLPGRAQGPLRRAREHQVVTRAGEGRRPRGARDPRAEDPRQGDPRGPPRGRRRTQLRDDRDRQLPRQERPPVRGLRVVHDRS